MRVLFIALLNEFLEPLMNSRSELLTRQAPSSNPIYIVVCSISIVLDIFETLAYLVDFISTECIDLRSAKFSTLIYEILSRIEFEDCPSVGRISRRWCGE